MIIGRIKLDDKVYEKEFKNVYEAVKDDTRVYFATGDEYDFYFNDIKLKRLNNDCSFEEEIKYLTNQVNNIKISIFNGGK